MPGCSHAGPTTSRPPNTTFTSEACVVPPPLLWFTSPSFSKVFGLSRMRFSQATFVIGSGNSCSQPLLL